MNVLDHPWVCCAFFMWLAICGWAFAYLLVRVAEEDGDAIRSLRAERDFLARRLARHETPMQRLAEVRQFRRRNDGP